MPSPERRRELAEASVATQFEIIAAAAHGCDLIVGATALQIAAPSVADKLGIPYVFAAYCPNVLPSPHHAPPPLPPIPADCHQRRRRRTTSSSGLAMRTLQRSVRRRRSTLIGRRSACTRSMTFAAICSPIGHGSQPIPRWGHGPIRRTRPCFRPEPGSLPMSGRCLPNWRRFSKAASHPSTSALAASARRKTLVR